MKLLNDFQGVITSAITTIAAHPLATVVSLSDCFFMLLRLLNHLLSTFLPFHPQENLKYFYAGVVIPAAVQKLIPVFINSIYVKIWPQLPRWYLLK